MEKLIKPSDLRNQAQELVATNKMIPLDKLLAAVVESRHKFGPQLEAARKETNNG